MGVEGPRQVANTDEDGSNDDIFGYHEYDDVEDESSFNSIDLCAALGFETRNQRAQALRKDDKTSFQTFGL